MSDPEESFTSQLPSWYRETWFQCVLGGASVVSAGLPFNSAENINAQALGTVAEVSGGAVMVAGIGLLAASGIVRAVRPLRKRRELRKLRSNEDLALFENSLDELALQLHAGGLLGEDENGS